MIAKAGDLNEPPKQAPRTRGECIDGPRPCPWIHCRYHLASEVRWPRRLSLRVIQPGVDTCALDVADKGEHTLEEIGALLGYNRERIRQIQVEALFKIRMTAPEEYAEAEMEP